MRIAFIVLLLVNGLLFLWGQGRADALGAGREPERLNQQVVPEKLRIVPLDRLQAAPPPPASE